MRRAIRGNVFPRSVDSGEMLINQWYSWLVPKIITVISIRNSIEDWLDVNRYPNNDTGDDVLGF